MDILALYSSPRPESNSSFLLDLIVGEAADNGHNVEKIDVAKLRVLPCTGCQDCMAEETQACWQEDGYPIIAAAIERAQYIFMATPLYWWYVSSQLKLVLDRSYPPPYTKFRGKTIHLVMTGQLPVSDSGYHLVRESFAQICRYMGCDFQYCFVSAHDGTHPARDNPEAIEVATKIGREL